MTNKENKLVEVARSFSFKLNKGNYETVDFFCSQKIECSESEADKKSEALYEWCKNQVLKSVNQFKAELADPMVEIRRSVETNPTPTVSQYEEMSPEEKQYRHAVQLKNNRRDYAHRKEILAKKTDGEHIEQMNYEE